jgi:hypothetical protein
MGANGYSNAFQHPYQRVFSNPHTPQRRRSAGRGLWGPLALLAAERDGLGYSRPRIIKLRATTPFDPNMAAAATHISSSPSVRLFSCAASMFF